MFWKTIFKNFKIHSQVKNRPYKTNYKVYEDFFSLRFPKRNMFLNIFIRLNMILKFLIKLIVFLNVKFLAANYFIIA